MGDDLVHHTASQAIAPRNNDMFMVKAFKTMIFAGSDLPNLVHRNSYRGNTAGCSNHNEQGNVISRLLSNFARAINTQRKIPKWVVIIPEANLLNCVNYTQFGVSEAYGIAIEYIMSNIDSMIQDFIGNNLPPKANKYNWPNFLWVEPTLHMGYDNNPLRIKFTKSLHIASMMHDRAVVLPLRLMWSDNSPNMIDNVNNRLSHAGLNTFWRGVDQLIRFAETKIMRNYGLPIKQVFQKPKLQKESEQFFDQFEKRMAARRDLTRQLQLNQVVRFFNNRINGPTEAREDDSQHRRCSKKCRKRLFKK